MPKKEKADEAVIELDWDMDPAERLKAEADSLKEGDQMRLVADALQKEFAKDPDLAAAYKDRKVTLEAVIGYIMDEAKKVAVDNRAMVSDETVYGWAIHFVQDGKVKEPKGKSLSVKALPKETEQEIAEKAKKDFYEAEMKRLAEEKRKADEKAAKEAEAKAKRDAEKAERKRKKAEEEFAKSGQMSLFEFFEDVEGSKA